MAVPLMFQPLAKYAQFEGRSRRSEFWFWVLFRILLGMALGAIAGIVLVPVFMDLAANPKMDDSHSIALMGRMFSIYPLYTLVGLGLFLPTLAVTVRRLHDINRSGWWVLLPAGAFIGGMILFMVVCGFTAFNVAGMHGHATDTQNMAAFVTIFLSVFGCIALPVLIADVVMLIFFVTEGTKGPNRFGEDPKALPPVVRPAPAF